MLEPFPTTSGQLRVQQAGPALPALFAPDEAAARRFVEFFAAHIRNPNTRRAYARAAVLFADWCEAHGLRALRDIEPVQVAAYVETLQMRLAAPSVKLHLQFTGGKVRLRAAQHHLKRSRHGRQPPC
jgi:hypothetical protein